MQSFSIKRRSDFDFNIPENFLVYSCIFFYGPYNCIKGMHIDIKFGRIIAELLKYRNKNNCSLTFHFSIICLCNDYSSIRGKKERRLDSGPSPLLVKLGLLVELDGHFRSSLATEIYVGCQYHPGFWRYLFR